MINLSPLIDGKKLAANHDKYWHSGNVPCVICGMPCKENVGAYVHAVNGTTWEIVTGAEFAQMVATQGVEAVDSGDMSFWPIGPACLRKARKAFADFDLYVEPKPEHSHDQH